MVAALLPRLNNVINVLGLFRNKTVIGALLILFLLLRIISALPGMIVGHMGPELASVRERAVADLAREYFGCVGRLALDYFAPLDRKRQLHWLGLGLRNWHFGRCYWS